MSRPLIYRGFSRDESSVALTSLALPAGTQPRDLLLLVGHVGTGSFSVTDMRFTRIADLDTTYPSFAELWVGYADDELSGVSLSAVDDGTGTAKHVALVAFGNALADPTRTAENETTAKPFVIPGLPDGGAGAFAVVVARHGIGSWNWTDNPGGYAIQYSFGSYNLIGIASIEGPNVPAVESTWSAASGSGIPTHIFTLGFRSPPTVAPPCRNIKRGDRLDLGGARNYPTSKMQQTSSRGVGAY